MDAELRGFLEVSAELGANPRHVQGPGGNTSYKLDDERMLVKASGFELSRALDENVFAEVRYGDVRSALARRTDNPLAGVADPKGPKPSIETTLHALMRHKVVLHTHSIPAIAASCRQDVRLVLERALEGFSWVLAEYARPGTPLAERVASALERRADANVVLLQNHGIVAGGDTPRAARDCLESAVARLETAPRLRSRAPDLALLARLAERHGLVLPVEDGVHDLALDPEHLRLATFGTLYPDHVVFLGSGVGLLADRAKPLEGPASPRLWLEPGVGALFEPGLPRAAEALAACLAAVVARLPLEENACRYLTERDEAEVLGMEEEKYRQGLARVGRAGATARVTLDIPGTIAVCGVWH